MFVQHHRVVYAGIPFGGVCCSSLQRESGGQNTGVYICTPCRVLLPCSGCNVVTAVCPTAACGLALLVGCTIMCLS